MSRALQASKIREIGKALRAAGYLHIDAQAEALGVSRSTAWTILQGSHKHSGLSASVIQQMLASKKLPLSVRFKILEYVTEKLSGHHGHSEDQLFHFSGRLSLLQASSPLSPEFSDQRRRCKDLAPKPAEASVIATHQRCQA